MDKKEIFYDKIQEWLANESLVYIDVFLQNGISFNFHEPNTGSTMNLEVYDDYIKAYGSSSDESDIEVIVPFDEMSHVSASFGFTVEEEPEKGE